MFQNWEEFKAMIKVNLVMQLLMFLGYFIFVDYEESNEGRAWWYYIDGVLLVLCIMFARLGYVAAQSKNKVRNMKTYLIYLFLIQLYEIFKFWPLTNVVQASAFANEHYSIIISQVVIGLAGIGTQIYTTIIARRYYKEGGELHDAMISSQVVDDNASDNASDKASFGL